MQLKVQFEEKAAHNNGLLRRNCVQVVRADKDDEKHESIECWSSDLRIIWVQFLQIGQVLHIHWDNERDSSGN